MYCNDYDWELFFRISNLVMPDILRDVYKRVNKKFFFYVLGGKAVDAHTAKPAYSENYIGSPDWDVDVVGEENIRKFIDLVMARVREAIDGVRLVVTPASKETPPTREKPNGVKLHGFQIGIETTSEQCGIIYFLDVFAIPDEDFEIEVYNRGTPYESVYIPIDVIDGIPYIPSIQLAVDLFDILKDRQDLYTGAMAMRPLETEAQLERIDGTLQEYKTKLHKYISKKLGEAAYTEQVKLKIDDYLLDIDTWAKEYQRIKDLATSIEKVDFDLKLNKQRLKFERTEDRLRRMMKMRGGILCETCQYTDVVRTKGKDLSCDTIRRYCE